MKNFSEIKIADAKIVIFVLLFLLTLAIPFPLDFNPENNPSTPLIYIYALLLLSGFNAKGVGMMEEPIIFLIAHIVIVFVATCLIYPIYKSSKKLISE